MLGLAEPPAALPEATLVSGQAPQVSPLVEASPGATQATLQVTGIANCRQAVGMPSLNASMYRLHSSSLAILPTVLNPPSGSLKNAVQVLRPASYAKQATFGPLYCCKHSAAVV